MPEVVEESMEKFMEQLVEEAEVKNIPISRLKWINRPAERAKMPASHFLLPKERKFPVKNKDGSYNCNLIRAAIVRAAQHGYPEVRRKAERLYARYCKKKSAEEIARMSDLDFAVVVSEKYTIEMADYNLEENKFKHLVMPFDKFYDPRYGELEFTEEMAKKILENFESGYPSYDPPLNIEHAKEHGRVGKVVGLEMREDGLYAEFELTEDGKQMLAKERFGYLSPEIILDYVDKVKSSEDNVVTVGPVLVGVALTNTPAQPMMIDINFAKEVMEKYAMNEEEECKPCEEKQEKQEEKKMAEKKEEKVAEKKEELTLAEANAKITALTEEAKILKEENEKLVQKLKEAEEQLKKNTLESWKTEWKAKGLANATINRILSILNNKEYDEMVETYNEIARPLLEELAKYVRPKVPLGQMVFQDNEYDPEMIGRKLAEEFNKKLEKNE